MGDYQLKEIKIEVTHRCPLACVHCSSNAHSENTREMQFDKCQEIINSAHQMGVTEIAFSGGEPLCWPGIVEAVKLAHDKGIKTVMYSSGNANNAKAIFEELTKAGLQKIVFSIYSCDEAEHNKITRIADSFQNTIRAIECIKNLGIQPEVHFVALASNYKSIENLVYFLKSIGVDRTSILRFVPQGRGKLIHKQGVMTKKQSLDLSRMIKRLWEKGFDIRTGSPYNVLLINEDPKCMAAKDRMIISPDLDVFPCDAFKQITAEQITTPVKFSNLGEATLQECWDNSSYFREVRKALSEITEPPCVSCGANKKCLSGCLAQKFLEYNTLYKNPDPACLLGGDCGGIQ